MGCLSLGLLYSLNAEKNLGACQGFLSGASFFIKRIVQKCVIAVDAAMSMAIKILARPSRTASGTSANTRASMTPTLDDAPISCWWSLMGVAQLFGGKLATVKTLGVETPFWFGSVPVHVQ